MTHVFWLSAYPWPDDGLLRFFGDEKSPRVGRSGAQGGQGALDALITLDALLYALLYIFGLAFAFYPLTRWCKQNEGFSWPWPHVQSEKKRIKELRREQQAQENEEKGEK